MIWDEHIAEVSKKLKNCSPFHLAAFAASIAERQLPNYRAFCTDVAGSNAPELEATLDLVWSQLLGADPPCADALQRVRDQLNDLVPEADNFRSAFVGLAQDAVGAVEVSVHILLSPAIKLAEEACISGLVSVSGFVGQMTSSLLPEQVDPTRWLWEYNAPIVGEERSKQLADADLLSNAPGITEEVLHCLRKNNDVLGVQPFRRGLIRERHEEAMISQTDTGRGVYREVVFPYAGSTPQKPSESAPVIANHFLGGDELS